MKEKDIQRLFGNYLVKYGSYCSAAFEIKMEKGKSMPFKKIEKHQIEGLKKARTGLYHKIADQTIGRMGGFGKTLKKPFDAIYIKDSIGFVGVCFYVPRKPKILYLIEVDNFVKFRDVSERKSLTEDSAQDICSLALRLS